MKKKVVCLFVLFFDDERKDLSNYSLIEYFSSLLNFTEEVFQSVIFYVKKTFIYFHQQKTKRVLKSFYVVFLVCLINKFISRYGFS